MRIGNRSRVTHRYEDRRERVVYVIPPGQVKEVPDELATTLLAAHPDKLYDAGDERMTAGDNRMIESPEPERPPRRPLRRKPRSR